MSPQNFGEKERERAIRNSIWAQCVGVHGELAFRNSLLLLYMLALGLSQTRVIVYLSIFGLINGLLRLPSAYYADRLGKKKTSCLGHILCVIGFALIGFSAFFPKGELTLELILLSGLIIFSVGSTIFGASWFALLRPIVPEEERGRYFGKLRVSWQITVLVFSAGSAWILGWSDSVAVFQLIMLAITVLLFLRLLFYIKLPELEEPIKRETSIWRTCLDLATRPGYMSFGSYIFLICFFTVVCPNFFALIEKEFLKLSPKTVVWLANIGMVGSLIGFYFGGRAVDRYTTKPVFMLCHFGFCALLFAFVFRSFFPILLTPTLWVTHFCFGFLYAASNIAITTETLALMPKENQSLAASLLQSLQYMGIAISGFIFATAIDCGFLKDEWTLGGMVLCKYDTILLGCATMILMLVITLGLVPSVIRRAEWLPGREGQ